MYSVVIEKISRKGGLMAKNTFIENINLILNPMGFYCHKRKSRTVSGNSAINGHDTSNYVIDRGGYSAGVALSDQTAVFEHVAKIIEKKFPPKSEKEK